MSETSTEHRVTWSVTHVEPDTDFGDGPIQDGWMVVGRDEDAPAGEDIVATLHVDAVDPETGAEASEALARRVAALLKRDDGHA